MGKKEIIITQAKQKLAVKRKQGVQEISLDNTVDKVELAKELQSSKKDKDKEQSNHPLTKAFFAAGAMIAFLGLVLILADPVSGIIVAFIGAAIIFIGIYEKF